MQMSRFDQSMDHMNPKPLLRKSYLGILLLIAGTLVLASCGGGGNSVSQPPAPPPPPPPPATSDFSLTYPSQVIVPVGRSSTFSVSLTPLNGFSGTVSITSSGLPSGVSCTPSTFTLDKNSPSAAVTLTAASDFKTSSFQFSLKAVSGSLSHDYSLNASSYLPPPILRNDFVDVGYSNYNFVNGTNFPGWHITIYDQTQKLFFLRVTFGNEVIAYDATKRKSRPKNPVPSPFGMDFTLDGKFLLVATGTHYLYVIDTANLQVHDRIDTTLWGTSGYTLVQPFGLVNNKIGFMSNLGDYLYIWNPADNSVEQPWGHRLVGGAKQRRDKVGRL